LDGTPIMILSARADDALRVELLREGAQDFVIKPFHREEIRARIANLVTIKRVRDLLQTEVSRNESDLETLAGEVMLRRQELERALAETRYARDEARSALYTRDEFLLLASHELRTPLTPLKLDLQILQRRLAGGAFRGEIDLLRHALESGERQV